MPDTATPTAARRILIRGGPRSINGWTLDVDLAVPSFRVLDFAIGPDWIQEVEAGGTVRLFQLGTRPSDWTFARTGELDDRGVEIWQGTPTRTFRRRSTR